MPAHWWALGGWPHHGQLVANRAVPHRQLDDGQLVVGFIVEESVDVTDLRQVEAEQDGLRGVSR